MENLRGKFGSEDSDFSVVCEDKEIKCHKLILASQSEYFKTLFAQTARKTVTKKGKGFNENDSNKVTIEDIDNDTMGLLLFYLYSLKLPECLSREQVSELLVAADRLQVIIVMLLLTYSVVAASYISKDLAAVLDASAFWTYLPPPTGIDKYKSWQNSKSQNLAWSAKQCFL